MKKRKINQDLVDLVGPRRETAAELKERHGLSLSVQTINRHLRDAVFAEPKVIDCETRYAPGFPAQYWRVAQ